jgi:hypothetical protein
MTGSFDDVERAQLSDLFDEDAAGVDVTTSPRARPPMRTSAAA